MTRGVTFTRDGRRVEARAGQSVAAALWQNGDRALSRSTKFHRPRAWTCGTGKCADCTMRVDGVPNVRTCVTPAEEGMVVEGQNAWPNVRRDLFRANDIVFRRFDHHRWFVRPRFLYPLFGRVIRAFAGWGRLPDRPPASSASAEAREPDVLVIGGGPAGLAAARSAADAGATVLLLDEGTALGGHAARMARAVPDPDAGTQVAPLVVCRDLVARWRREVEEAPNVEILAPTSVSAAYRNGLFLAKAPGRLVAVKPKATVIATGAYHAEAHFINNDLPGVMGAQGCQALLHREGVRPGQQALVYGAGAHGLHVALDLHEADVEVACVVEPGDEIPGPPELLQAVRDAGIAVYARAALHRVDGFSRVRRATVHERDGSEKLVRCDLVVVATGTKTTPEFFQALGATLRYDPARGGAVPVVDATLQTSVPGVYAAGDTSGIGTLAAARAAGRLAGRAAAAHTGRTATTGELAELAARLRDLGAPHGQPASGAERVQEVVA